MIKKIILTILFTMVLSGNVYAITFEKCYAVNVDYSKLPKEFGNFFFKGLVGGKDKNYYILKYYLDYDKDYNEAFFDKEDYESHQYKFFLKNNVIQWEFIYTDSTYLGIQEIQKEGINSNVENFATILQSLDKINQYNFQITKISDDYIEAGDNEGYIRLNLKRGTVFHSPNTNFNNIKGFHHCKTKGIKTAKQNNKTFKNILGKILGK